MQSHHHYWAPRSPARRCLPHTFSQVWIFKAEFLFSLFFPPKSQVLACWDPLFPAFGRRLLFYLEFNYYSPLKIFFFPSSSFPPSTEPKITTLFSSPEQKKITHTHAARFAYLSDFMPRTIICIYIYAPAFLCSDQVDGASHNSQWFHVTHRLWGSVF